ncbi:MAG: helix-hairpin-helix domain-containing protein, partial [Promethearchaeota archaeon]
MVRPKKYLLDENYELTPDLDLESLPLEALQSVSKRISTKLQTAGINNIPELANASLELKVKGVSQKDIKKAISYAQDVMQHASEPGLQEGIMPLEEMLDKKHEKTPVNEIAGLELEAIQGLTKTDATKIRKANIASTIQELAVAKKEDLKSAGLTNYKADKIVEFATMVMTYIKGEPVAE